MSCRFVHIEERPVFLGRGSALRSCWKRTGTHTVSYTAGEAHHTAVVTAVLPNGDVLYSQHTTNGKDLSLTNRMGFSNQDGGTQNVRVIRPKETW